MCFADCRLRARHDREHYGRLGCLHVPGRGCMGNERFRRTRAVDPIDSRSPTVHGWARYGPGGLRRARAGGLGRSIDVTWTPRALKSTRSASFPH
jgi:hypothetical protein